MVVFQTQHNILIEGGEIVEFKSDLNSILFMLTNLK